MILLYGLPSLVAQGFIFVGFMYVMAYLIQGLEFLFNKNYAKISRIAKNELFMSFSPQQR